MKQLFFITLLVLSSMTCSAKYINATIRFVDGKIKKGLVSNNIERGKLYFKSDSNDSRQAIDEEQVRTITFHYDSGDVAFDRLQVYIKKSDKISKYYFWMKVLIRDYATLYIYANDLVSGFNPVTSSKTFYDYYIIREGEAAARLLFIKADYTPKKLFREQASLYFGDYPELSEQIKSDDYTWKDVQLVVEIYNKWVKENK